MAKIFRTLQSDFYASLLEFIGTTFFLLFGLGGIQASANAYAVSPETSSTIELVLYVSTSMGLSLLVSAWLFYRVTGGLFNPNISLALLLVGVIGPVRCLFYCIAQLCGAITASALILALTSRSLAFNTILQKGVNVVQGTFIESFITAALVLAVLMLAVEKHTVTPFAPIGVGLTLFAGHLFAVFYTGAAMNTARAFGPAVVTGFPYRNHWVYWVGPFLGSLFGTMFYTILKHWGYWRLNPDQATEDPEKSPPDPVGLAKAIIPSWRKEQHFQNNPQVEGSSHAKDSSVHGNSRGKQEV